MHTVMMSAKCLAQQLALNKCPKIAAISIFIVLLISLHRVETEAPEGDLAKATQPVRI